MNRFIQITLFILAFSVVSPLSAQFNIKIGYSFGYTTNKIDNQIIDRFNTSNTNIDNPMQSLRFLNGVMLGGRQRIADFGICLAYENRFAKLESTSLDPLTSTSEFRNLYFRYLTYSIGLEGYASEEFTLGASLDIGTIRHRAQGNNDSQRFTLLKDNNLATTIYFGVNLEGTETLTLSLQPYVQIPLRGVNTFQLEQYLNPADSTTANPDDYTSRYLNFGIKVVFYNGYFR